MKTKAIESYKILNQLIGDFIGGTRTLQIFSEGKLGKLLNNESQISIHRMCMSHLILALAKFIEFYKKYRSTIPEKTRNLAKETSKELEKRGVVDFRNTVVGHIWDKTHRRPISDEDIKKKLTKIKKDNHAEFILWINNFSQKKEDDMVGICTKIRDNIKDSYNLRVDEIFMK